MKKRAFESKNYMIEKKLFERAVVTLSMTSKTAAAAPNATAKVCSSGRALPRENDPITTAKNT